MNKEDVLQAQIVKWFRNEYQMYGKGVIFAVPNGGSRNVAEAVKLKKTGLMAGVSDLIILFNNKIIFCEVKTDIGKQSEKQLEFQNKIKNLGFEYYIVRSLTDFITIL